MNKNIKKIISLVVSAVMMAALFIPFAFAKEKEKPEISYYEQLKNGTLRDGKYEVGIEMVRPDQVQNVDTEGCNRSMANGAVRHKAIITVTDGKPTKMNMTFAYLDLFGKRGYLGWLKVNTKPFPENYNNFDEYRKSFEDVEVISYVLDEDGNKYIDEYNDPNGEIAQKYPKCRVDYSEEISFPVHDYFLNGENGFISCQVLVPVMESMGGFGTQEVITRIAWNGGWTEAKIPESGKLEKIEFEPIKPTEETIKLWNDFDAAQKKSVEDLDIYKDLGKEGDALIAEAKEALMKAKTHEELEKINGEYVKKLEAIKAAKKEEEDKKKEVEEKNIPDSLDFSNLEDGEYTINGEMIKTNQKEFSMSNKALDHNVLLTVKNGKYYITLTFKGIKVGNKLGYLGKMRYYDDNGKLQNAEVVETVEYDGKTYPSKVRLPLTESAKRDGWQKLQVFVQTMEDIAKGCGTQDVYIRLDGSTVKAGAPKTENFSEPKTEEDKNATRRTVKTGDTTEIGASIAVATAAGFAALAFLKNKKEMEKSDSIN